MDAEPHLRLKLTSIDALLYNIFMTLRVLIIMQTVALQRDLYTEWMKFNLFNTFV